MNHLLMGAISFIAGAYVNQHFKSIDKQSAILEEAYTLSSDITKYANAVLSDISIAVACLSNNLEIQKNFNSYTNPFPRLKTIIDFHLNAPQEIQEKIDSASENILVSMRPLTEAINGVSFNKDKKDALFFKAISDAIDASKSAELLQNELLLYIKNKNKLLRLYSSFPDLFSWLIIRSSSLINKAKAN
ncbi:MAG TPA: hypothetical protein VLI69_07620 [Gammaproteobacteria bacterium]|nr:hypothetical protein [Gammaproteobacteria bacterium]